ncbi:MAG: D-glycero-alpha-D-manno-heptose-1,7-bisphosphate 7-phosphatase [Thermodesulfobacteriota bacterium]
MNIGVFLDRDGTINEEMGYINHLSRFQILPRAAGAIRLLNNSGLKVVVATNQSGPARGYFPEGLIIKVNNKMIDILKEQNARLDGIYYCPHHREAVVPSYRVACDCRKPKTGLLKKAAQELAIDLSKSYVVGDRFLDIELAHNAGAKGILVLTGYGRGELMYQGDSNPTKPDFVAEDLWEAAQLIIKDIRK